MALSIVTVLLVLPSVANATWPAVERDEADFAELLSRAEQQRAAGEHAAAARLYAAAYRALSEVDRVGLLGEVTLDNALVDYVTAYAQAPDERALLEEPVGLLEEFIEARSKAYVEGVADPVPERLEDELARLRAEFDQVRATVESGTALEVAKVELPSAVVKDEFVFGLVQDYRVERLKDAGLALIAVGALGIATGVTLIVLGERPKIPDDVWSEVSMLNLRPAGIATAGIAGGAIATGIILYALRKRVTHKTSVSIAPMRALARGDRAMFSLYGRF